MTPTTRYLWAVAIFTVLTVLPEMAESFAPAGKRTMPRNQRISSNGFPIERGMPMSVLPSKVSGDDEIHLSGAELLGSESTRTTRRTAVARLLVSPIITASVSMTAASMTTVRPSFAADITTPSTNISKQTKLSQADFVKVVVDNDLVQNQFLVNGKLTKSVYDDSCTFRDEIDTYGLEQWMSGTAKLFDGDRSKVVLVPGSVRQISSSGSISMRFVEYLCFNIPVVKPIVYLSGTLLLERSQSSGLVTSYREEWDQDIYKVLSSKSKLFTSGLSGESLNKDLDVFFAENAEAPAKPS